MNIGFLFSGYDSSGGIETIVKNFTNLLVKDKKNRVTTIAFKQINDNSFYDIHANINNYHLYNKPFSMTKALLLGGIRKLRKIIESEKIDYLIACGSLFYILGIESTKKTNAKCICWEHTHPSIKSDYKTQMFSRKYAVKKADKIVVLTKDSQDYYLKKLDAKPDKVHQIYNFASDVFFQSNGYDFNSKKILSVGRLSYPKNYELLVDVAKIVLDKYSDWSWDIYGDGPNKQSISNKIKTNGLLGRLNLKGNRQNILSLYKDYSIFVMTSRYEGFPMVLLEASANKLPLVSFDIPGINEIIMDGTNGFLIELDNKYRMAEQIIKLIENYELRATFSRNAFNQARNFKSNDFLIKWKEILNQ